MLSQELPQNFQQGLLQQQQQQQDPADGIASWGLRIATLLVGLFLAVALFMPNIMMSDSGTARAERATKLGIMACQAFALGGVLGCFVLPTFFHRSPWWGLLPGLVLQTLAFIAFS